MTLQQKTYLIATIGVGILESVASEFDQLMPQVGVFTAVFLDMVIAAPVVALIWLGYPRND